MCLIVLIVQSQYLGKPGTPTDQTGETSKFSLANQKKVSANLLHKHPTWIPELRA